MVCLSDNDVILKLAACNLLDDVWGGLGVSKTDVYVLPTAKHKLGVSKNPKWAQERFGNETFSRLRDFFLWARDIDVEIDQADLQSLLEVEGIDSGEAVLFAASASLEASRILTGDKRSLRALASDLSCRPVAARLVGRVICFEQIVKNAIGNLGFAEVLNRVLPGLDCDTALRAAFGSGKEATEVNVVDALDRYIVELRSLPIDFLSSQGQL